MVWKLHQLCALQTLTHGHSESGFPTKLWFTSFCSLQAMCIKYYNFTDTTDWPHCLQCLEDCRSSDDHWSASDGLNNSVVILKDVVLSKVS